MHLRRWLLAGLVLVVVAGVAYMGQEAEPAGAKMTASAQRFLATLSDEQKQKAQLPFDSPNRTQWYFTPQQANKKPTRKGVPLEELKEPQRKLALELLAASTSAAGKQKADLEKGGGIVRDPDWYFVTIFGNPGPTGKWSWRLEGHHLSLNYTIENGLVAGATPCFYGANPREVPAGERKGFRALPKEEDLARQLIKALQPEQQKTAWLSDKSPANEIKEGNAQAEPPTRPEGLAADKMNEEQKKLLMSLLNEYTGKLPTDVGRMLMQELTEAGTDKIHFAWIGGLEARQPHYYRVHGPTFILEYVCVQNQANHIHSCWRSLKGDFGLAKR
jgi:hypothetical protein